MTTMPKWRYAGLESTFYSNPPRKHAEIIKGHLAWNLRWGVKESLLEPVSWYKAGRSGEPAVQTTRARTAAYSDSA